MSSPVAPTAVMYRWHDGALHLLDYCDMTDARLEAADSWLVSGGRTLALGLHRERFFAAVTAAGQPEPEAFWQAVLTLIPREGDWFPRVELQLRDGAAQLVLRHRSAPALEASVVVASHHGADPRTAPTVKGPDLAAMQRLRVEAQAHGAGESIILSPDGYVVEGAYSSLVWWRGSILCSPSDDLARVDSVTAKSLLTLATALGVETFQESVTPAELDGTEIWALSALHGARIVTRWVDGPSVAELPGRLATWRTRLSALTHPLPETTHTGG